MLAASQDIDSFIERQRSKLNNQPSRQTVNRQPPPRSSIPPNNVQDRLDYKVARIFDEPPPHAQSQQPYYPSSSPPPPPFNNNSISEQQENFFHEQQQQQQQQQRRRSYDNNDNKSATFFNKFGTYDDKRSQLKDDLKREYNEYLQSKKGVTKSKSTSQLATPRGNNTNKRVQFQEQQQQQQPNGKVVAPWEKNDKKTIKNVQSMNDLPSTSIEYSTNRPRPQISRNHDEEYIQDREEYISELHSQIRELEARRKQLEMESSKLSAGGSSNITRAHYNEDLNALDSLLAERLDQRNAVDHELARILNRPPVSASTTRVSSNGMPNQNMSIGHPNQMSSQRQPQQNGRHTQPYRNDNRSGPSDNGFQIGHDVDKDAEQASKKRYQQELQAQMREAQMRKAQAKQDKDEYERKLDAEVQRYNYFGRNGGGGGAPMRDKDGNVVANLADVRNPPPPPPPPQQQQHQQQQQYYPPDDKAYSLGYGTSAITNAPFYNGAPEQQYSSNTDRVGSPNHTRGAASNGLFGTAKTETQFLREEKYKQELKQQIEDKRQRAAEETARRRAEEERELAKHLEWQQQMDRQVAEDASRKQEKEAQERLHQQQLQEDLERQKKQEEIIAKRKPKRQEKPMTPKRNDDDDDYDNNNVNVNRQNDYDEQQQQAEPAYRTSSPPIPALKNKGKKPKSTVKNVRRQSFDDINQQQSPPPQTPLNNNDDFAQLPPIDDADSQGRQTYRKPPTPRQPDISSARKKPPPTNRPRPRVNSNSNMPMRTNSTTSLRSDGSDSEVLNRLEHLKRQLKDKETRLQEHVSRHQTEPNPSSNIEEQSKTTYQPPSQAPLQRKQSPAFLFNAARVHHHRDSPTSNDKIRRMLQTDDDMEFKPNYFRDDTILMGGASGNNRQHNGEYYSSSKRIDSGNQMFITNTEKEANRRRYGLDQAGFYDQEDPTTMANYELNRIAEQNQQRLKKLRDLEKDDASLLDSNEVLERFQQKQRLQRGSQTTLQDDAWLK